MLIDKVTTSQGVGLEGGRVGTSVGGADGALDGSETVYLVHLLK